MSIGTTYLTIILLWCGPSPGCPKGQKCYDFVDVCRKEAIACVQKLKNFTTDDVVAQCLMKDSK